MFTTSSSHSHHSETQKSRQSIKTVIATWINSRKKANTVNRDQEIAHMVKARAEAEKVRRDAQRVIIGRYI